MEIKTNKSYESDYYNLQGASTKPIRGILIYEEAQKKLDISEAGKLYKQKFYNYIPIIGTIIAVIYANFCIGKTKCLRNSDQALFRGMAKYINLFGLLIWPLLFLGIWTILTFISLEFSNSGSISVTFGGDVAGPIRFGEVGSYSSLWNAALISRLSSLSVTTINEFFKYVSVLFSGLWYIFTFPLTFTNVFTISNAQVNCNLIFIISIIIITMINPVNIFNACVLNAAKLRFVIVYEASSIYRYRQKYI